MRSRRNRVYFPVESLTGLGHFNRAGKIVRGMVADGYDVSVASGTFIDQSRFFAGARKIAIPPHVIERRDNTAIRLYNDGRICDVKNFDALQWQASRSKAHVRNVSSIKPDMLMTEFWPFDRPVFDSEMRAMLQTASRVSPHSLKCVSVRDILEVSDGRDDDADSSWTDAVEQRRRLALSVINDNFNAVLVHGDPNFVPFEETFPLADQIKAQVIYTGYVVDDLPTRTASHEGKQRPLLVSCGSGVDGDEMMYSFLTAWQLLLRHKPHDARVKLLMDRPVMIVTGPRFNDIHYRNLTEWVQMLVHDHQQDITLTKYRPDYTKLLANCAFSISFAGYNTTLETLALQVPSLLIPKYNYGDGNTWIASEQLYRLKRLQQNNYAAYAHPEDVQDAGKFAEIILSEFIEQTTGEKKRPQLDFGGAANTLKSIQELTIRQSRGELPPLQGPSPIQPTTTPYRPQTTPSLVKSKLFAFLKKQSPTA